jgi:hypothetical protein
MFDSLSLLASFGEVYHSAHMDELLLASGEYILWFLVVTDIMYAREDLYIKVPWREAPLQFILAHLHPNGHISMSLHDFVFYWIHIFQGRAFCYT